MHLHADIESVIPMTQNTKKGAFERKYYGRQPMAPQTPDRDKFVYVHVQLDNYKLTDRNTTQCTGTQWWCS